MSVMAMNALQSTRCRSAVGMLGINQSANVTKWKSNIQRCFFGRTTRMNEHGETLSIRQRLNDLDKRNGLTAEHNIILKQDGKVIETRPCKLIQEDLTFEIPTSIIHQSGTLTSVTNLVSTIASHMGLGKTTKQLVTVAIITNLVTALLSIAYSILSMVQTGNGWNVALGVTNCVVNVANAILNIVTLMKLSVDLSTINDVVGKIFKTLEDGDASGEVKTMLRSLNLEQWVENTSGGETLKEDLDIWHDASTIPPYIQTLRNTKIYKDVTDSMIPSQLVMDQERREKQRQHKRDIFGNVLTELEEVQKQPAFQKRAGVFKHQANQMELYMKGAAFLLSATLTTVCVCTGKRIDIDFIKNHQLRKSMESNFEEANSLLCESLYTFAGIKVGHDIEVVHTLDRIHQKMCNWLTVPDDTIFYDRVKYYQVVAVYNDSVEFMKLNTTLKNNGANSLKQGILAKQALLAEKIKKCQMRMRSADFRQETVALHLFGNPGCGKTEYVTRYLVKEVAKQLGNAPDIYNITFSNDKDYWNPYGGQPYAVYDEFLAQRQNDPIIPHLNKICSTGYHNLPAAFDKEQPCAFEMIGLIGNCKWTDLAQTINGGATEAFYSRLHQFRVKNVHYANFVDKMTPTEDTGENTIEGLDRSKCREFAQPEFQHLVFQKIKVDRKGNYLKENGQEKDYGTYTAKQLVDYMVKEIQMRRVHFEQLTAGMRAFSKFDFQSDIKLLEKPSVTPDGLHLRAGQNGTFWEAVQIPLRELLENQNLPVDDIQGYFRKKLTDFSPILNGEEIARSLDNVNSVPHCDLFGALAQVCGKNVQVCYPTKTLVYEIDRTIPEFLQFFVEQQPGQRPIYKYSIPVQNQADELNTGRFVMLLHGTTGAGKTYAARKLAAKLQQSFKLDVKEFAGDQFPEKSTTPKIYIANDAILNYTKWMTFYDNLAPGSIVLASANVYLGECKQYLLRVLGNFPGVPPVKQMRYLYTKNEDFKAFNAKIPEGWYRRIGLQGQIQTGYDIVEVQPYLCLDYAMKEKAFFQQGKEISFQTVLETLFEQVMLYNQRSQGLKEIQILNPHDVLLPATFDVDIKSPTWMSLFELLHSKTRIINRYIFPTSDEFLKISQRLIHDSTIRFRPEMFQVRELPTTVEEAKDVARRTYAQLRQDSGNFSVRIVTSDFIVYGLGDCIYYYLRDQEEVQWRIQEENGVMIFRHEDIELAMDLEEVATYYYYGMRAMSQDYHDQYYFIFTLLEENKQRILNSSAQLQARLYELERNEARVVAVQEVLQHNRSLFEEFRQTQMWATIETSLKVLSIILGVGMLTTSIVMLARSGTELKPTFRKFSSKKCRFEQISESGEKSVWKFTTNHECVNGSRECEELIVKNGQLLKSWKPAYKCHICDKRFAYTDVKQEVLDWMHTWCPTLVDEYEEDLKFWRWILMDDDDSDFEDWTFQTFEKQGTWSDGKKSKKKETRKKPHRDLGVRTRHADVHANEPKDIWVGREPALERWNQAKGGQGYIPDKTKEKPRREVNVTSPQSVDTIPSIFVNPDHTSEALRGYLEKACVQVWYGTTGLHGIVIKKDLIICPDHLIGQDPDWHKKDVKVVCDKGTFSAVPISRSSYTDVMMLQVVGLDPGYAAEQKLIGNPLIQWENAKDLTSWFVRESNYKSYPDLEMWRFRGNGRCDILSGRADFQGYKSYRSNFQVNGTAFENNAVELVFAHGGEMKTYDGDCGFPYVKIAPQAGKERIVGFHIAVYSSTFTPLATIITQELLQALEEGKFLPQSADKKSSLVRLSEKDTLAWGFQEDEVITLLEEFYDVIDEGKGVTALPGNVMASKDLDPICFHSAFGVTPRQEPLRTSTPWSEAVLDLIPNDKANAVTYINDVEDPSELVDLYTPTGNVVRKSIGWTQVVQYCDEWDWDDERQKLLDDASEVLLESYNEVYGKIPFRTLSHGEVLNGIRNPNDPHYGGIVSMDMTTSAGPYWQYKYGITKKEALFKDRAHQGEIHDWTWNDTPAGEVLQGLYHDKFEHAKAMRVVMPSKDCLKMELVTTEKAKKGKTRIFVAVDVLDILFVRRVAGTLMAAFKKNRDKGHCQVGINPIQEFTTLFRRFSKIGVDGHAGDYKAFDKHLLPPTIRKAFDLIYTVMAQNWCDQRVPVEHLKILVDRMYEDFVHTMSICEGVLYVKHRGNPSGNVLTSIVNSIVNDLMVTTTIMKLARPKEMFSCWIPRNVDWVDLGDDLIVVLSEEAKQYLGFNIFKDTLGKLFSIKMTHPSKQEIEVPDWQPISELSFLSRQFQQVTLASQVIFPKMKTETIGSLIHWTTKNSVEQMETNLISALEEALLHDRDYYDTVVQAVCVSKKYMRQLQVPIKSWPFSRQEIERMIAGGSVCQFGLTVDQGNRGCVPSFLQQAGKSTRSVCTMSDEMASIKSTRRWIKLKSDVRGQVGISDIRANGFWMTSCQQNRYYTQWNETLDLDMQHFCGVEVVPDLPRISENETDLAYDLVGDGAVKAHVELACAFNKAMSEDESTVVFIHPSQYDDFLTHSESHSKVVDGQTLFYKTYNGSRKGWENLNFFLSMSLQKAYKFAPADSLREVAAWMNKTACCFEANKGVVRIVDKCGPVDCWSEKFLKTSVGQCCVQLHSEFCMAALYTKREDVVIWMKESLRQHFENNSVEYVFKALTITGKFLNIRARAYTGTQFPWKDKVFLCGKALEEVELTSDQVRGMYERFYPTHWDGSLVTFPDFAENGGFLDDYRKAHHLGFARGVSTQGKLACATITEFSEYFLFLGYHDARVTMQLGDEHVETSRRRPSSDTKLQSSAGITTTGPVVGSPPDITQPGLAMVNPGMTLTQGNTSGNTLGIPLLPSGVSTVNILKGGILLDLKELVYGVWMNLGEPIQYTQDTPKGSTLAEYQYGKQLLNPYARFWVDCHERFVGPIMMRFIMNGAAIFRGKIQFGVFHKKQDSYTIVEAQKIKAALMNVNEDGYIDFIFPFTHRYLNWLNSNENLSADINLPVLVLQAYIELINPYDNPGSTVVIQALNKMHHDFVVSIPLLPSVTTVARGGEEGTLIKTIYNLSVLEFVRMCLGDPSFDAEITLALDGRMYPDPNTLAYDAPWQFVAPYSRAASGTTALVNGVGYLYAHVDESQGEINANIDAFDQLGFVGPPPDEGWDGELLDTPPNNDLTWILQEIARKYPEAYCMYAEVEYRTTMNAVVTASLRTDATKSSYLHWSASYNVKATAFRIISSKGLTEMWWRRITEKQEGVPVVTAFDGSGNITNYQGYKFVCANFSATPEITTWSLPPSFSSKFTVLPTGLFRALVRAKDYHGYVDAPVPVLASTTTGMPSVVNFEVCSAMAKWLAEQTPEPSVSPFAIDLTLTDPNFNRIVATLRYQKNVGCFLINPGVNNPSDEYVVYVGTPFRDLIISNAAIKQSSQPITPTATSTWITRGADARRRIDVSRVLVRQAAMVAGGLLSGLGQGLSSYAQMENQLKLQSNQFEYNMAMSAKQFYQRMMQQNDAQAHETALATQQLAFNAEALEYGRETSQVLSQQNFQQQFVMQQQRTAQQISLEQAQNQIRGAISGYGQWQRGEVMFADSYTPQEFIRSRTFENHGPTAAVLEGATLDDSSTDPVEAEQGVVDLDPATQQGDSIQSTGIYNKEGDNLTINKQESSFKPGMTAASANNPSRVIKYFPSTTTYTKAPETRIETSDSITVPQGDTNDTTTNAQASTYASKAEASANSAVQSGGSGVDIFGTLLGAISGTGGLTAFSQASQDTKGKSASFGKNAP